MFFTIATLFDAEPDQPVADGRPQPLENLPDAVSVNIHPLAFNRQWVPGLFLGGKPPAVLPPLACRGCWEISMVDFTVLIQVRPRAQRLRSTRVQTSTGRVRPAAPPPRI